MNFQTGNLDKFSFSFSFLCGLCAKSNISEEVKINVFKRIDFCDKNLHSFNSWFFLHFFCKVSICSEPKKTNDYKESTIYFWIFVLFFDCPVSGLNWDLKVVSCSSLKNLKHLVNVKFFTDGGSWTFFSPSELRVVHNSRFDLDTFIASISA